MNIWWIRRDLRLTDNQALSRALAGSSAVIPVFILDPALWNSSNVSLKRIAFMLDGLRALDSDLRQRGCKLILREGAPSNVLIDLMRETNSQAIYAEEDYTPYARRRDADVAQNLPLHLTPGLTVHHPNQVLKSDGTPYTVFTPFSRTWKTLPIPTGEWIAIPDQISVPERVPSLPIPVHLHLPETVSFQAGEHEAQKRLQDFIENRVFTYHETRDRPDLDTTSRLSPYLRFGMISARQAANAAYQAIQEATSETARMGAETWLSELIWREFFHAILYHYPDVYRKSFREKYRKIKWNNDPEDFAAWQEGKTGYPIVDAAMRQLQATGWMHNRLRMIVASFLTKDLLIDWRWGQTWFMQHLVDGDPAANNGGWQWSAGTGTDAAPYFRVFNPTSQGRKYDPEGIFIRRWVPELHNVVVQYIHEPWTMPLDMQEQAGCLIGKDYPAPIIDHQWAYQRTLHSYQEAAL